MTTDQPTGAGAAHSPAPPAPPDLLALAVSHGHVFPAVKGYEPYGAADACWITAWNYAAATGLHYAEGAVLTRHGWQLHGWCATDDGAVIEPTHGFDAVVEYRGWVLDPTAITTVLAQVADRPNQAFLQAALDSGATTWTWLHDRFCHIPGTI